MSNPTSNFGWQMPTATDLVTDLPADFEVFGQAVDTALMDLKGGTTGQVLKKNTNTDMDFVWAADSAGMTNPMTTTGDMIYSSSGSTPARLGIGSAGQVLNVTAGIPAWTTIASSPIKQIVTATLATATSTTSSSFVDTGLTASITPSSVGSKIVAIYASSKATINGSATSMTSVYGDSKLLRGATTISASTHGMDLFAASNYKTPYLPFTITIVDSPASTSALTYKVQYTGSATMEFVFASAAAPATLILMEI